MSNKSDPGKWLARLVLILLFAGSVMNYTDRSLLSVVMPQAKHDLGLTNTDYGMVVNAFLLVYAVFYILGGRIGDRLGCRRMFTVTVFLYSLATMAHTLVRGLGSLIVCRALLGVGESSFYPAAMRGAAEWFPPASRAKAVGFILSAISVGLLIAPPMVAWVALHYGWRAAFLVIGALGLLLLPPWWLLQRRIHKVYGTPDPTPASALNPAANLPEAEQVTLAQVLRSRKYWCVLSARGCTDAAWYFYLFWIPGYFQEVRGLSLASVGKLLWIPYFCSIFGALGGAAASSDLIERGVGVSRSRLTVLLASAVVCMLSASACFAPGAYLALTLVTLALFGHQSWSANIHTVITEISPARHVAILYGITGAAGTLLGAASQVPIGHIIDTHGYTPAFVWAGGMYVLAMILLVSAGTLEPLRRKLTGLAEPLPSPSET
jgi:ACS family hexuronate transporter-like MFS transporter